MNPKSGNEKAFIKTSFMKLKSIALAVVMALLLMSCNTLLGDVANAIVESDLEYGLETVQKQDMKGSKHKKDAKEQEQLKKEGKCLKCRGMGRSIDGKYACPTCNGTGLLQNE